MTIQAMQAKLQTLRDSAGQLDTTAVDKGSKGSFSALRMDFVGRCGICLIRGQKVPNPADAPMWLDLVELQLHIAEKHLKNAAGHGPGRGLQIRTHSYFKITQRGVIARPRHVSAIPREPIYRAVLNQTWPG